MAASDETSPHLESIREPQPQARLQVTGFLAEFERRLALAQSPQEPAAEATTATGRRSTGPLTACSAPSATPRVDQTDAERVATSKSVLSDS